MNDVRLVRHGGNGKGLSAPKICRDSAVGWRGGVVVAVVVVLLLCVCVVARACSVRLRLQCATQLAMECCLALRSHSARRPHTHTPRLPPLKTPPLSTSLQFPQLSLTLLHSFKTALALFFSVPYTQPFPHSLLSPSSRRILSLFAPSFPLPLTLFPYFQSELPSRFRHLFLSPSPLSPSFLFSLTLASPIFLCASRRLCVPRHGDP